MRAARIVGDEAIAIIIEPEEFEEFRQKIGSLGSSGDPTTPMGKLLDRLNKLKAGMEDGLLYESPRDMPEPADPLDGIEVVWA